MSYISAQPCKSASNQLLQEMRLYVTESEKRGHFAQNANFYHFSNCYHAKAFRALASFTDTLGLLLHRSNLKATACLQSGELPK